MRPRPPRTPAKILLALTISISALTAFVIGGTSEASAENEAIAEQSANIEREAAELAELQARLAFETRAARLATANDEAEAATLGEAAELQAQLEARERELAEMKRRRKSKKKYGRGY